MCTRIAVASAVFAMFAGLVATSELQADDLVFGGGWSESDGFWVSSPNVRFRQDGPGVAFGLIQPPGSAKTFAYFVLIKGVGGKVTSNSAGCKNDGRTASSSLQFEVDGAKLELEYQMEFDRQNTKVVSESLTANGKVLDPGKGRVLLITRAGKEFTCQQAAAELPKPATAPRTTEEVETLAKEQLKRLRQESDAVRAFLK
jgi:hypothetical protein